MSVDVYILILQKVLQVPHQAGAHPGIMGKVDIWQIRFGAEKSLGELLDVIALQVKGLEGVGGDELEESGREGVELVLGHDDDLQVLKVTKGRFVQHTETIPIQVYFCQVRGEAEGFRTQGRELVIREMQDMQICQYRT